MSVKKFVVLKVKSKYEIEAFSSKKELCKKCGFNYSTIKSKKMPFFKDGYLIQKIEINKIR